MRFSPMRDVLEPAYSTLKRATPEGHDMQAVD